jgi:sugar/nucleoside kinase (ribokinase family)
MFVSDPELTLIPGVKVTGPIDPTGAGDSATAGAVLTLASVGTPAEAALVGNLVASITVQQLGTTGTASPQQVLDRLELWRQQHPAS